MRRSKKDKIQKDKLTDQAGVKLREKDQKTDYRQEKRRESAVIRCSLTVNI